MIVFVFPFSVLAGRSPSPSAFFVSFSLLSLSGKFPWDGLTRVHFRPIFLGVLFNSYSATIPFTSLPFERTPHTAMGIRQ